MVAPIDKAPDRTGPPRTFWVRYLAVPRRWAAWNIRPQAADAICVIEKSAYDRLLLEATKLELRLRYDDKRAETRAVLNVWRKYLREELELGS